MNATLLSRYFFFALGLALLTAPRAHAQDAIARKAYSAHYDRVYVLGGGALPNYDKLNDRLQGTEFPKLKSEALLFGVGYGQGSGAFGLALEWRLSVRANDVDSTEAFTNLLTNTFALMGRYNLLVTDGFTVSALLGPTYNRLNLTLKEGIQRNPQGFSTQPTTFDGQVVAGGNKRKLHQSQLGISAGLQLERHFDWTRRNDVQACGRARQITVGARVQYDYVAKRYRWHTENPLFRPNTRLDSSPNITPIGFSAALVVGGLFNRY